MQKLYTLAKKFLTRKEEGASAAEYALILAVITLGIVGAAQALGSAITTAINTAASTVSGAGS